MYRTVIFLPLLLASAAVTVWELNSHDTKKTWEYVAYQSDGIDELQFYCDNVDPDDIQMLVVTSLDAEAGDDEFADVSVNALIDGVRFDDLSGYYDEVEGERTVVLETREEARVRDILDAAQAASQPIQISYDVHSHRFSVTDIGLDGFVEGCER